MFVAGVALGVVCLAGEIVAGMRQVLVSVMKGYREFHVVPSVIPGAV